MSTRKRWGAEGPPLRLAECSPPIGDLEAIARTEARRCPGLAPNGGRRWTAEDIAFAVSLLEEITLTDAFRQEFPRGLDGRRSRGYLLSALQHDLVHSRRRDAWLVLLDILDLDRLPGRQGGAGGLAPEDARCIARRFLGGRSAAETAELTRQIRGIGLGAAHAGAGAMGEPSRATRARLWARVRQVLMTLAKDQELTRTEMSEVLAALAVKLTVQRERGAGIRRNSENHET